MQVWPLWRREGGWRGRVSNCKAVLKRVLTGPVVSIRRTPHFTGTVCITLLPCSLFKSSREMHGVSAHRAVRSELSSWTYQSITSNVYYKSLCSPEIWEAHFMVSTLFLPFLPFFLLFFSQVRLLECCLGSRFGARDGWYTVNKTNGLSTSQAILICELIYRKQSKESVKVKSHFIIILMNPLSRMRVNSWNWTDPRKSRIYVKYSKQVDLIRLVWV